MVFQSQPAVVAAAQGAWGPGGQRVVPVWVWLPPRAGPGFQPGHDPSWMVKW